MTGCTQLISAYLLSSRNCKVTIADGSASMAAGTGTIKMGSNMMLKGVLYVPNLACNLLSINKITKDLGWKVAFPPSTCIFQDRLSEKKIGSARELNGLYYFENVHGVERKAYTIASNSIPEIQQIMLLHYRLGDPSLSYLKFMFPKLSKTNNKFQSEICQLA